MRSSSARRGAGVVQMIVTGSSEESTRQAIDLVATHPGVLFATAGVHPHHAVDLTAEALPTLEANSRRDPAWSPSANAGSTTSAICPLVICSGAHSAGSSRSPHASASRCSCISATRMRISFAILREHRVSAASRTASRAREQERDAYLELGLHIGITGLDQR